ncbi:hypothetical protein LCGC14_1558720 [marine sediment metagenome]|uniref:Uncharacterized protein n=1 Tax=marine sediment metagenome TaxID=412755 RepID=A0A0F9IN92_9ZZZZ
MGVLIELRKILAEKFKLNQREKYKATFKRFGVKNGYKGDTKTVLLLDVVDQNHKLVASHLWMNCGKRFDKLQLEEGDFVQFYARVKIYGKRYQGYDEYGVHGSLSIDYGLCYPSKVVKLSQKYIIKNLERLIEN